MIALLRQYKTVATIAVLLAAFFAGWLANGWRLGGQIAEIRQDHETQLRLTAEANAAVILKQQADQQALAAKLAALDQQRYTELRNAQENTDRLAAELAASNRRLSVRASCPAVPAAASASGVDAGTQRADIHPEDAAAIVRITGDADACAVKLSALQEWAREITKGN